MRDSEGLKGHEIFARSALIQPSFFPKESRPLTKSPIYEHSPFLNKMLLFDHQAAGKKGKKGARSNLAQKLGFAMERKYYNTDLSSMFNEPQQPQSSKYALSAIASEKGPGSSNASGSETNRKLQSSQKLNRTHSEWEQNAHKQLKH